ncbi:3-phenylpropionate/cinnamic acid dioxygenase ferredoxin--NAD(+) reductase component [Streptomyces tendae]
MHTLRTLRDADRIREDLARARQVVVVGAGFIGLEFAAAARDLGHEVTVVEALRRPLSRITTATTAEHLTRLHEERGNRMLFGQGIAALTGDTDGHVTGVELADGRLLPANLVLAGVGVAPRTELAEAAGLAVDGGIVTDARLLTADTVRLGGRRLRPVPPSRLGDAPAHRVGAERGRPRRSGRRPPHRHRTRSTSCPGSGATSSPRPCRSPV